MNLQDLLPKIPLLSKTEEKREFYFALNIGNKDVVASVWGIEGKGLQILNIAKAPYSTEEEIIDASNMALDNALGSFEPEPTKILFGVPDSWLQDDNLKEERLAFLKKLTKELDVNPMAYVSTTHAMTHLLQKVSGIPPTDILVEVSDPLVVTIVKGGKMIGTKTAKRGDNLAEDIEKVLAGFTGVEVLPSKISLYGPNTEGLEKFRDELVSFNWMGNLPFLHLPKVEILEDEIPIKAISLAGASEVMPDVTYHSQKIGSVEVDRSVANLTPLSGAGFVTGDIAEQHLKEEPIQEDVEEPETRNVVRMENPLPVVGEAMGAVGSRFETILSRLRSKGSTLPKTPSGIAKNKGIWIAVAVVVLLVLAYVFLPHATVTVYVDPKVLEKDEQVIADPKVTSVDDTNKVIPGKVVTVDVSGADKGTATGTKQVGSPAKGSVVLIDKDESSSASASLAAGTVLVSSNGLKFTLDSSTSVPAPSQTDGTWGTVSTSATASQIGPDSNLSSGTALTVQGYDSSKLAAKVDTSGLSGGTSQNVTVVTASDQDKLLATVDEELRQKAITQLQSKLTGDEKVLPEALAETVNSKVYSKNVGDQASDFTLNLSVHYTGTAYSDTDLKQMVAQLVQTNVPDGYTLNLADTQTEADVSKLESDGRLIFLARFKANLLPKLDVNQITQEIKGQSPDKAESILQGIDNVLGADISIRPSLPGPFKRLPFLSKNISISVTTK